MKGARFLILVLALLALASVPSAAAPLASPCAPGMAYDPACDVNHDNQITITDIQLTAGHWNQSGTWVSDNNHNHLGQEWTGTNTPLKLTGSYTYPDSAPLVLSNYDTLGDGLKVTWAGGYGVHVVSARTDGVYVGSPGVDGVHVGSAGGDGMDVGSAGRNGVYVHSAGNDGVYVGSAGDDGLRVCTTGSATSCSPHTLNNGVEIGNAEGNGVLVLASGNNGVWAHTTRPGHDYGFFTPDRIYAGTTLLQSLSLVAQVDGPDALTPGDLVAAAGVADPLAGSPVHVPLVRLADGTSAGLVGVVETRLVLEQAGELLPADDGSAPIEPLPPELHSAEGPAQPGDYVAITVLGVAQVKVQDGEAIQPGQRLTVSATPGQARALQSKLIEGMMVTEGAPVIGTALEASRDGLVWVLVNPQ